MINEGEPTRAWGPGDQGSVDIRPSRSLAGPLCPPGRTEVLGHRRPYAWPVVIVLHRPRLWRGRDHLAAQDGGAVSAARVGFRAPGAEHGAPLRRSRAA